MKTFDKTRTVIVRMNENIDIINFVYTLIYNFMQIFKAYLGRYAQFGIDLKNRFPGPLKIYCNIYNLQTWSFSNICCILFILLGEIRKNWIENGCKMLLLFISQRSFIKFKWFFGLSLYLCPLNCLVCNTPHPSPPPFLRK